MLLCLSTTSRVDAADVAHGALSFKYGLWKLHDTSQSIEGVDHLFDQRSDLPAAFELAFGPSTKFYGWIELLIYLNDYTSSEGRGSIHPMVLSAGVRYSLDLGIAVKPYAGIGLAVGTIPAYNGDTARDPCSWNCVGVQYIGGLEAPLGQWDKLVFFLEYKYLYGLNAQDQSTDRVYDISGAGLFTGLRLLLPQ